MAGFLVQLRQVEKRITIKDSAIDADSQICDEVRFTPVLVPGALKTIWLPKYVDCFNSYSPPVLPEFMKKNSTSYKNVL